MESTVNQRGLWRFHSAPCGFRGPRELLPEDSLKQQASHFPACESLKDLPKMQILTWRVSEGGPELLHF